MRNLQIATRILAPALMLAGTLASVVVAQSRSAGDRRDLRSGSHPYGATTSRGGDLDGDGDVDIVFGTHGGGYGTRGSVYLNRGDGSFLHVELPHHWVLQDMVLADLDGDGVLDLYAGVGDPWSHLRGGGGIQNGLYLGDGSGGFVDVTSRLPSRADVTRAVAAADLDGDGDLDLLVGNGGNDLYFSGDQNQILINDGRGFFTYETWRLPARIDDTLYVALVDIEGDGDLDALMASDWSTLQYINDGSGVFTIVQPSLSPLPFGALAVADVDLDGDADLFVHHRNELHLFRNDGPGRFVAASFPHRDEYSWVLGLADFDENGRVDVLSLGQPDRYWLNSGHGSFQDATERLLDAKLVTHESAVVADFDGDGDLDVFVGSQYQNHLLLNDGRGRLVEVPLIVVEHGGR